MDQGRPASMQVSDGSDSKVQEREKHMKENPGSDDTDQVNTTEAGRGQTQVTPIQISAPPPPSPAAHAPQTADLTDTIKLHKNNYLDEVIKKHPAAEAPIVGPGRSGVWKQTLDGLKEAGVPFKETKDGLEINIKRSDPKYKNAIEDMRKNELDPKMFLDKIK